MAYKAVEKRSTILDSFNRIQNNGGATYINGDEAFSGESVVNTFIDIEREKGRPRAEAAIYIYTERYAKSSQAVKVNINTERGTIELLSLTPMSKEEQENLEREYVVLLRKYGILASPETKVSKEVSSLVIEAHEEKLPAIRTLEGQNYHIRVKGTEYGPGQTPGHISEPPQLVLHWANGGVGNWWIDYVYIDSSGKPDRVQAHGKQWPFKDIHLSSLDYIIE